MLVICVCYRLQPGPHKPSSACISRGWSRTENSSACARVLCLTVSAQNPRDGPVTPLIARPGEGEPDPEHDQNRPRRSLHPVRDRPKAFLYRAVRNEERHQRVPAEGERHRRQTVDHAREERRPRLDDLREEHQVEKSVTFGFSALTRKLLRNALASPTRPASSGSDALSCAA